MKRRKNWQEICDTFQGGDYEEYVKIDTEEVFAALMAKATVWNLNFHDGDIIVINWLKGSIKFCLS